MADEKGITLVSLLVAIAILAILAAVAIPNWVQEIQQEDTNEAIYDSQAAIQRLFLTALSSGGAMLKVTTGGSSTTYTVWTTAGTQSIAFASSAPAQTVLGLAGAGNVTCIALDSRGIPVSSAGCSLPSGISYPLSWSVTRAGQTIPLF